MWDIDNELLNCVKTALCAFFTAAVQSNTVLRFLTLCCAFYSVCDVDVVQCVYAVSVCVDYDVIV